MRRVLLGALYGTTLATLAWLAHRGWDYYSLPLVERPRHPLHWELKPGGEVARVYGVAGLSMMVAMLGYSLRKRLPLLRKAGRLRDWLDVHIYFGVTGPLLIVLHSAFKVGGLIAIAFWSMVAVALSGILGRFLYAQIPRTAAGDQLSLDEARRLDAHLADRLRAELGLVDSDLAALDPPADDASAASVPGALVGVLLEPWRFRRRLAAFRRAHPRLPRRALAPLARLGRERALLRSRLRLWRSLHDLFHYWHVFHKPFALLMYLFAGVHIGVAWATGYAFGGR